MPEGRLVISFLMLAVFAAAVGFAFTYAPQARMLPLVIGIPGLLLSLAQCIKELYDRTPQRVDRAIFGREIRMFGWFLLFVAGLVLFGFLYAGPVLVAAYLYFAGREKWYVAAIAAFATWAVLYGIFLRFLGLPPFEGLVTQWLFS
jgi:small-conductance mechanosensitive channel